MCHVKHGSCRAKIPNRPNGRARKPREQFLMSLKTTLQLKLILPSLPDVRDRCVERLTDLLRAKEGIDDAHLRESSSDGQPELCVHYNPDRLSVGDVRELAKRAGLSLASRYGHVIAPASAMHAAAARALESRLRTIPGVLEAVVSPAGVVRVEYDRNITTEEKVLQSLSSQTKQNKSAGREEGPPEEAQHTHEPGCDHDEGSCHHGGPFGEWSELVFAGAAGLLLLVGWLTSLAGANPWIPRGLYLASYAFGGLFTVREAIENLRDRRFEIDSLMLLAAVGAAMLGEWMEGALLLFLFSVGHSLEHYAMGRAKRAIEALGDLAPQTAVVHRDGQAVEVPVSELKKGEVVVIKPNERIPADGFVLKGESSVNQAPITGESIPVDKRPVPDASQAAANPERLEARYRIFAGTINESGALEIQVTKLSTESTLARVIKMVGEAETQKSPTQRFTDRFERYFVPAVLGLTVSLLFAWVVIDEPFSASFYRAMAVLVAASPCALAISTPSAVLSGVARAARGGVLVKGGGPLENLGTLKAIAFDKTGTLTEGKPRLTDVVPFEGASESDLLAIAISVEGLSDHPLAAAVVRGGRDRMGNGPSPEAVDLKSITGRGVKATVNGETVYIGKDELFNEVEGPRLPDGLRKDVEALEAKGRTTMIVRLGDRYLGMLGLMDTPRQSAKAMIAKLRELGITRMLMLSGDNQQVADAIAKEVGLDEAMGDLMPDDKVAAIKRLGEKDGVAMVGDGVNDAPALANATVGIAMGAAGSDVALETADVALMADDLSQFPFAVGLSRQTRRIIQQNLWFSLGMVVFLVPATIVGLKMGAAVAFHEGSTILVVFNALRLLAYRAK